MMEYRGFGQYVYQLFLMRQGVKIKRSERDKLSIPIAFFIITVLDIKEWK